MNQLLQREKLKKDRGGSQGEEVESLGSKDEEWMHYFLNFCLFFFILGMLVGMLFCGVKMA